MVQREIIQEKNIVLPILEMAQFEIMQEKNIVLPIL